jgi:hypothetical protein
VDLGSVIAFRAVASNGIDAYVDYSGTVWSTIMNRHDSLPRTQMLQEMTTQLRKEHGVVLLGALGFENAYALAMRRDRAEALGIRTIADLSQHAPELRIGGDFEFFARSEWAALRDRYGLHFREQRQFQPTFLYKAVATKEVDVISAASSDGRIRAYDLVVLEDPQQVIPPYDAIVLISPARASDPVLRRALEPLVGCDPDRPHAPGQLHGRSGHRADLTRPGGALAGGFAAPPEVAYLCSSARATEVMEVTPVRSVGSGSGWKRLVCRPGASLPAAWAAANFAGSMAPSQNNTVGMRCPSSPKMPKSSLAMMGSSSNTLFLPSAATSALLTFAVSAGRYKSAVRTRSGVWSRSARGLPGRRPKVPRPAPYAGLRRG